jgi:hypothetical protein
MKDNELAALRRALRAKEFELSDLRRRIALASADGQRPIAGDGVGWRRGAVTKLAAIALATVTVLAISDAPAGADQSGFGGMNVEQMESAYRDMGKTTTDTGNLISEVDALVSRMADNWLSQKATDFNQHWTSDYRPSLVQLQQQLFETHEVLRREIDAQKLTSSGNP